MVLLKKICTFTLSQLNFTFFFFRFQIFLEWKKHTIGINISKMPCFISVFCFGMENKKLDLA